MLVVNKWHLLLVILILHVHLYVHEIYITSIIAQSFQMKPFPT